MRSVSNLINSLFHGPPPASPEEALAANLQWLADHAHILAHPADSHAVWWLGETLREWQGPEPLSYLDVGCSLGCFSGALRESDSYAGIDVAPESIRRGKERHPHLNLSVADVTKPLPFPAESFDRIICASVLQSIPGEMLDGCLRELRRVLKPDGGAFFLEHLAPATPRWIQPSGATRPWWFCRHDPPELLSRLAQAGFATDPSQVEKDRRVYWFWSHAVAS